MLLRLEGTNVKDYVNIWACKYLFSFPNSLVLSGC